MWRQRRSVCTFLLLTLLAAVTAKSAPERSDRKAEKSTARDRYTVEDIMVGDIPGKQLTDNVEGQHVWILPTQGGRVEAIRMKSATSGVVRDVILTHNGNSTAIKENALFKGAVLLPFANRIANGTYMFQGKTYHLKINEPERQNALHGLLYDKELTVLSSVSGNQYAILVLQYVFDGTDPGYPFRLTVQLDYILTADGFVLSVGATNEHASRPLPFYMGWHPYFKVTATASTVVLFAPCSNYSHIVTDKTSLIPTGTTEPTSTFTDSKPIGGTASSPTYIDDGYAALAPTDANCTSLEHIIYDTLSKEATYMIQTDDFRFTQAFTGSVSISGEQGVAVEPMSAETDAFNNHIGLSILNAQQQWRSSVAVSLGKASEGPSFRDFLHTSPPH